MTNVMRNKTPNKKFSKSFCAILLFCKPNKFVGNYEGKSTKKLFKIFCKEKEKMGND
jgi:hypothetical protein